MNSARGVVVSVLLLLGMIAAIPARASVVSPRVLDFGKVCVGADATKPLTFGDAPKEFSVELLDYAVGPPFKLSGATCTYGEVLQSGKTCTFDVIFFAPVPKQKASQMYISYRYIRGRKLFGFKHAVINLSADGIVCSTPTPTPTPTGPTPTRTPARTTETSVTVGVADSFHGDVAFFHYAASGGFSTAHGAVAPGSSPVNVAPFATIGGSNTGLNPAPGEPFGIALDSNKNIYVANVFNFTGSSRSSITIYPPLGGSTGLLNEAPRATIAGQDNIDCTGADAPYSCCTGAGQGTCIDNTGLQAPTAITVDSSGNIYVTNYYGGSFSQGSITEYPPLGSSSGLLNEAPIATIAGQFNFACTGLGVPYSCCTGNGAGTCVDNAMVDYPTGIVLDDAGNIYVTNYGGGPSGAGSGVTAYAAGSNGNPTPFLVLKGTDTGFNGPAGLSFDRSGDLLVTNRSSDNVTVYSPLKSGEPDPPIISGSGPVGIASVEVGGQQLTFVADSFSASVTVYNRNGDLVSTLAGSSTGLGFPAGIVVLPSP
ncbi:MAG TPA: hypothetical protein VJX23_08785 [Candidatus Binataceae bacterium]|nr:hypothetical protein [Candidatus Binataceae bacterium]